MPKRKLLEGVREVLRIKHCCYRTENSYIRWIRKFVVFHQQTASARHGRAGNQAIPKLSYRQSKGGGFHSESRIERRPLSLKEVLQREIGFV